MMKKNNKKALKCLQKKTICIYKNHFWNILQKNKKRMVIFQLLKKSLNMNYPMLQIQSMWLNNIKLVLNMKDIRKMA